MTRRTFLTKLIQFSGIAISLTNPVLGLAQIQRGQLFRSPVLQRLQKRLKTTVTWEDRSGNTHQKVFWFNPAEHPPNP